MQCLNEGMNARMSGLTNYNILIPPPQTPAYFSVENGFAYLASSGSDASPLLAWSAPSDTHGKKNTFYVASASRCYGCHSESFLSYPINHLSPLLWSGTPAPHQSHSSTWLTMHMRSPSTPISSFHELGMMKRLGQSSQRRREHWLGLLSAKGLPTTTTLQLTGFMT